MAKYTIQDTTLTNMANAIRDVWHEPSTHTMTPEMMTAEIGNIDLLRGVSNGTFSNEPWTRPNNWPDLDSITLPTANNGDVLYLTYDLSKVDGICDPFISVAVRVGAAGTVTVCRGHINDHAFVADETHSITVSSSGNYGRYYQELDPNDGTIQLWQITATVGITRFGFTIPSTNTRYNTSQPCVEKYGRLDHITYLSGSTSATSQSDLGWGTFWLEREKIYMSGEGVNTTLGGAWSYNFSLRSLDVTNWNTTNWAITNLSSMFSCCHSLQEVDLSHWDTSNWAVVSMTYMVYQCTSLKHLNLSTWNTENWAVTKLEYSFGYNSSLLTLDMSTWDTSNWKVATMNHMFIYDVSLTEVDLNNWDTSDWEVTSIASMFYYCTSLHTIKIDKWDTSNWPLTGFSYTFGSCLSLKELNLNKWDTSKWGLTGLNSTFAQCSSLHELDLSDWNTSGWKPTSIASLFAGMLGVKKIDISGWDTSGWTTLTSISSMFSNCQVRELYLPADFLLNSNYGDSFNLNSVFLMKTNGFPYKFSHTYSTAYLIDHNSLVSILNRLPTSTNKTITLSNNKYKLTESEIAIATAKGWTVA